MSQSDNPFAPPSFNETTYAQTTDPYYAENKVKPCAMTLLITTIVMMVVIVLSLILNLLGVGMAATSNNQQGMEVMIQGVVGMVQGIIGLAVGTFVIYGSNQMLKLQNYSVAVATCILSMIPCLSPCCIIGLPVGIWGLVILNDPQVKSAFQK